MIRVAAGILSRGDRILICQRGGTGALVGKWEFPGGKLATDESAEQALVRELFEELGVRVRADDLHFLETLRHDYPGGPQVELHFFRVREFAGEPRNLGFRSMEWVEPRHAAGFDFLEADRPLLRRLAAEAGQGTHRPDGFSDRKS
jgi:mutator protein MutT